MKKQLILAVLSAVIIATPYAEAASGFGRSGSSSTSRPSFSVRSSTPSYKPAPTPSYKPTPAPTSSYKPIAAAAPNLGSLRGAGSANPLRTTSPAATIPTTAAAGTPAPAKSGFSTSQKVVGVAAATALGGALYAAHANHEAVKAYDEAHKPQAPQAKDAAADTRVPTATVASGSPSPAVGHTVPAHTYQPAPQPQVIVVQSPRSSIAEDIYWAERAHTARRQATRDQDYRFTEPMGSPATYAPHSTVPVVGAKPASSSGHGFWFFLLTLTVIGLVAFVGYRLYRQSKIAHKSVKTANYTL